MNFDPGRKVHILGVAGAGMSALAILLAERGCVVSGCDAHDSATLEELARRGVTVSIGHDASHVGDIDVLTASPAVRASEPELVAAQRRGIVVLDRKSVLAELARVAPVVAVAGTHGKTTTSSMVVHIFSAAHREPSWLIGAPVLGIGAGGHWGRGELILETDESYGTFTTLVPATLAITNVEADHLDYYGDLETLERAFAALVERTTGAVVAWTDDAGARRVAGRNARHVGRVRGAQFWVHDEVLEVDHASFVLESDHGALAISLAVTSPMNVANAAVAAALSLSAGVPADAVVAGLASFPGAPRRFERAGVSHGTTVIVDYAHLPSEVANAILAARASGFTRVGAVFQPHRVTRTTKLAPEFAASFDGLQALVVTDIYRAGEANPEGVTGELVARAVGAHHGAPPVRYVGELDAARAIARSWLGEMDAVLLLGAGDVNTLATELVAP